MMHARWWSTYREVGYEVVAPLLPHNREQQVAVVLEGRGTQHLAHIGRQVVGEQLRTQAQVLAGTEPNLAVARLE